MNILTSDEAGMRNFIGMRGIKMQIIKKIKKKTVETGKYSFIHPLTHFYRFVFHIIRKHFNPLLFGT